MKRFLMCYEGKDKEMAELKEFRILENGKLTIYRGEWARKIDLWLKEEGGNERDVEVFFKNLNLKKEKNDG